MEITESEAETYSIRTSVAITLGGEELADVISNVSTNIINKGWLNQSHNDLISLIVRNVEQHIKQEGGDLTDDIDVGWFIGIYVKAYIQATKSAESAYTKMFSEIFVYYYNRYL